MNKFLTLTDFEFKRNFKYYISLIITMCSILFINLVLNFNTHNLVIKEKLKSTSMDEIYNIAGGFNFSNLISDVTRIIFIVGIFLCLAYSLVIWIKDFKDKSIYTFLMLPNNRIKIYFSKFLNILSLLYMYIMGSLLILFIAYTILPKFMLGKLTPMGFVQETVYEIGMFIPYNLVEFICIYVFLMTAIIFTIFTLILVNKSLTKEMKLLMNIIVIPMAPLFIMMIVFGLVLLPYKSLSIVLYSIINIAICFKISNDLLNNKIDF